MTASPASLTLEESPSNVATPSPVIRFLKGAHLLGQCAVNPGETIVEHALACGITLPTNCTSGTCGTCMVSLILGEVPLPEVLPPASMIGWSKRGLALVALANREAMWTLTFVHPSDWRRNSV